GAGRKVEADYLFSECNESVRPYGVPKHRHLSEIEQELSILAGEKIVIQFTPHLVPVNRGIVTTIYADIAGNVVNMDPAVIFNGAAVFCDIKKLGTGKGSEKGQKRDLALIVSDIPAVVAGVFTTNQVCAAPVKISRQHVRKELARAIVVNSGNANACTGLQGLRDAQTMARLTASAVDKLDCFKQSSLPARISAEDVLVCSTGRIGMPMPMKNIDRGIRVCAPRIARSTSNARQVAEAIMTTDMHRKEIAVELKVGRSTVRMGGICKGAGMIQPGMATMIGFITTDAAIEPRALKRALKIATEKSFNRITVDGDMSTNDSVIA